MTAHLLVTGFLLIWSGMSLVNNFLTRTDLGKTIVDIVQLKHLDDFPEAQATIAGRRLSWPWLIHGAPWMFLAMQLVCSSALAASFASQLYGSLGATSNAFERAVSVAGYAAWSFYWLLFLLVDLWFYVWLAKPSLQNAHLILFGMGVCLLSTMDAVGAGLGR